MEDGKEQERPSANAPADSEKSVPSSQEEVAYAYLAPLRARILAD